MTSLLKFVNKLLEETRPESIGPDDIDPQQYVDQALDELSAPLDDFTEGYIASMLWSSTGDDDEFLDKKYGIENISPAFMRKIRSDCARFQQENAADLEDARPKRAGHDFWLTRNGHGAGFLDAHNGDPYPDDVAERLGAAAHSYGAVDVYEVPNEDEPDEGKVHAMQEAISTDNPEGALDDIAPDAVQKTYQEQQLKKRGFAFHPDNKPPFWQITTPFGLFVLYQADGLRWDLHIYPENDAMLERGSFDEMLKHFDALNKNVQSANEAINVDNPEGALDDLEPDEVQIAYQEQQLKKRGFVYRAFDGTPPVQADYWVATVNDCTFQFRKSLASYGPFELLYWPPDGHTRHSRGSFNETMETFDQLCNVDMHYREVEESEDDDVDPAHYLDWLGKVKDANPLSSIQFGCAIYTSNDDMLHANAHEAGVDLENADILAAINQDCQKLERNVIRILRRAGFLVSDEGHDGDGALVCSMWVFNQVGVGIRPDTTRTLKHWVELNDWVATSIGNWGVFGNEADRALWANVSEVGQQLLDVSLEILNKEKLEEWFELNVVSESEEPDEQSTVNSYIDSLEDVVVFCADMENFGFFVNSGRVWGRWVILDGFMHWAVVGTDEQPMTLDIAREMMAKFTAKHHAYSAKVDVFQKSTNAFYFKLAVPTVLFSADSLALFSEHAELIKHTQPNMRLNDLDFVGQPDDHTL